MLPLCIVSYIYISGSRVICVILFLFHAKSIDKLNPIFEFDIIIIFIPNDLIAEKKYKNIEIIYY